MTEAMYPAIFPPYIPTNNINLSYICQLVQAVAQYMSIDILLYRVYMKTIDYERYTDIN